MKSFIRLVSILFFCTVSLDVVGADPNVRALSAALEAAHIGAAATAENVENLLQSPATTEKSENASNASAGAASQLLLKSRQAAVIKMIDDAEEFVELSTPFFSDPAIQNALIRAHGRGIRVDIRVGSRARVDRLNDAGICVNVVPGLHAKMIITEKESLVGSDNLSQLSRDRYCELLVGTSAEQREYHAGARERFRRIGKSPRRRYSTSKRGTPRRLTVKRGHGAYKARRLKRLISEPSAKNRVDIGSMTFDSGRIVSQIEKVYKDSPPDKRPFIRLFLDRAALKHRDLLDRMKQAGADDLEIYIFNAEGKEKIWGKFTDIMHQKYIARKLVDADGAEQKYVIISTGNLANQSDLDINIDSHHPGDDVMYDQLTALGDKYASSPEWTKYHLSSSE